MLTMAGRVCDGVRLHGFATRKYLEEVAWPALDRGLERAGRAREDFEVWGGGFLATGADDEAVAKQVEAVRYRIAFYGSTRSYHPVLAVHDAEDLGMKLHDMSKKGLWKEMAAEVPDDLLHEFVAVARYDELKDAIERRFGGLTDSLTIEFPASTADGEMAELVADLKTIPSEFRSFPDAW